MHVAIGRYNLSEPVYDVAENSSSKTEWLGTLLKKTSLIYSLFCLEACCDAVQITLIA